MKLWPTEPPARKCTLFDKSLPWWRKRVAMFGYHAGRAWLSFKDWSEFRDQAWHFWWGRCALMPFTLPCTLITNFRYGWRERRNPVENNVRASFGLPPKKAAE